MQVLHKQQEVSYYSLAAYLNYQHLVQQQLQPHTVYGGNYSKTLS